LLRVPADKFRVIHGASRFYQVTADTGNTMSSGFCLECGSPLFSRPSGMPNIVGIRAGSLDDPRSHARRRNLYKECATMGLHES
jgi:hypothetical protein